MIWCGRFLASGIALGLHQRQWQVNAFEGDSQSLLPRQRQETQPLDVQEAGGKIPVRALLIIGLLAFGSCADGSRPPVGVLCDDGPLEAQDCPPRPDLLRVPRTPPPPGQPPPAS